MSKNRMDGLKKAEEKVVADTHKPYEPTVENVQPTEIIPEAVVEIPKPEAPVAKPVVCPKCEKRNVLVNDEGAYCTACGSLGSAKDVAQIIADKKDTEAKLNAEWNMPPLPKVLCADDDKYNPIINDMIRYITWLGKHFRREMNFVCPCGKEYSPKKAGCPNCNPVSSLAVKR